MTAELAAKLKVKWGLAVNRYKKLLSDTLIFAIGTFSSKVLVFLLMPLYTRILTTADYGSVDLIMQTGNLLFPVVTAGIVSGVVRYGLDKSYNKRDVFSTGVKTTFIGLGILLVCMPLFMLFPFLNQFQLIVYLYLFVVMSSLRYLCSQFVRAIGYVKLYAFDGILSTVLLIVFNVLFLVVFRWGITGYILATVAADVCSTIFLFITAELYKYTTFKSTNKKVSRSMLRYSIPLIPNNIFWWITNVSDRYILAGYCGTAENGLYAAAQKVPTIINLVSSIFMDAWQLSAMSDMDQRERSAFFTKVFRGFWGVTVVCASGLITLARPITTVLVGPEFYDSWKFIPLLILSMVFSCFVSFLGSIYMVERNSNLAFVTTAVGAVTNIVLNFMLIPQFGGNGAAFATFLSYFLVFLIRMNNTKKYIKIHYNYIGMILGTGLLLFQSWLLLQEGNLWFLWQALLSIAVILINAKDLVAPIMKVLKRGKN